MPMCHCVCVCTQLPTVSLSMLLVLSFFVSASLWHSPLLLSFLPHTPSHLYLPASMFILTSPQSCVHVYSNANTAIWSAVLGYM